LEARLGRKEYAKNGQRESGNTKETRTTRKDRCAALQVLQRFCKQCVLETYKMQAAPLSLNHSMSGELWQAESLVRVLQR